MKQVHRGFSAGFSRRGLRENDGCSVVTLGGSKKSYLARYIDRPRYLAGS